MIYKALATILLTANIYSCITTDKTSIIDIYKENYSTILQEISKPGVNLDIQDKSEVLLMAEYYNMKSELLNTTLNFKEYLAFARNKFDDKLFIINQQMDGNKIIGKTADRVNFDADLKFG